MSELPPPDEPTEDRVRRLLLTAAETVDVTPTHTLRPVRRPRWPILAAAAAVVIVVAGSVAALEFSRSDQADRPSPGGPTTSSSSLPPPLPPAPGTQVTVPPMQMMTPDQARQTLDALGLEVQVKTTRYLNECDLPPNRVFRSTPGAHSRVESGSTVTVEIYPEGFVGSAGFGDGILSFCVPPEGIEQVIAFADFARFGQNAPDFADSVDLWIDGALVKTLSARDAADTRNWGAGSPLTRFVAVLNAHPEYRGRPDIPFLSSTRDNGTDLSCGSADPPAPLRGRPSTVAQVLFNRGDCHWLRIYEDQYGNIDAVAFVEADPVDAPPAGLSALEAQAGLGFIDLATDGPGEAPRFASTVQLLLANVPVTRVPGNTATQRATWQLECESYAERSCPIDGFYPLTLNGAAKLSKTEVLTYGSCAVFGEPLPPELADPLALANSVTVTPAESESCGSTFTWQLWLDDEGAIYAANLVLGSP